MGAGEPHGFHRDGLAYGAEVVVELWQDREEFGGHGEADRFGQVRGEERVGGHEGGEGIADAEGGAFIEFYRTRSV